MFENFEVNYSTLLKRSSLIRWKLILWYSQVTHHCLQSIQHLQNNNMFFQPFAWSGFFNNFFEIVLILFSIVFLFLWFRDSCLIRSEACSNAFIKLIHLSFIASYSPALESSVSFVLKHKYWRKDFFMLGLCFCWPFYVSII